MAGPQEYIVREKSIVETGDQPLSACAQLAKDLAFQPVIERLREFSSVPQQTMAPSVKPPVIEQPSQKAEPEPAPKQEVIPNPANNAGEPTPIKSATAPSEPRRLEFADLRPASSLIAANPESKPAAEPDDESRRIEKARAMQITILGKLHDCNGWTAGRILDERPEIIVDMVKRYNGPKVEEKEALRTLYNEALRKVSQAA